MKTSIFKIEDGVWPLCFKPLNRHSGVEWQ